MDIQEEVRISEKQNVVFMTGAELSELYEALRQHWQRPGDGHCDTFMASMFYNMGRVHGIRAERARRKGKAQYGKD